MRDEEHRSRNLVCQFRYALYGGKSGTMSARIKSIDVKHSDTIIIPTGGFGVLLPSKSFPLRTDINVELRLWTKGGPGGEKVQKFDDLYDQLTPEWY